MQNSINVQPLKTDYDICIVGAGSTGLSLLLSLINHLKKGKVNRILLVDKQHDLQSIPGRSIALNQNTLNFFNKLKFNLANKQVSVLDYLASNLEPIKKILTKTATNGQVVIFDAQKKYYDQFGADIDLALLVKQLEQCVLLLIEQVKQDNPQAQIDTLYDTSVESISLESQVIDDQGTRASYRKLVLNHVQHGKFEVKANFVCINNGAKFIDGLQESKNLHIHDHQQVGIIADVIFNKPINGLAIEYFNAFGPTAFLPTSKTSACVVYCTNPENADLAQSPELIAQKLNNILLDIGDNNLSQATSLITKPTGSEHTISPVNQQWIEVESLDKNSMQVVKISPCAKYPLTATMLKAFNEPNLVYLGNAAHTLHPVSGQGFNLAVLSIQSFIKAFEQVLNQDCKNNKYKDKNNFAQHAYKLSLIYNKLHQPIATEVFKRTNTLAQEFSVKAKSPSFIRDFTLYHLNAYPILQDLVINPSIGKTNNKGFSWIYRLLNI